MQILIILLIGMFIFFIGYAIGRRIGIKEGYDEGVAYQTLKMREEIYKDCACPIETMDVKD